MFEPMMITESLGLREESGLSEVPDKVEVETVLVEWRQILQNC